MIRTESAALKASSFVPPTSSQPASVMSAIPITAGTKDAGDTVGEPLYFRLLVLRVLDQAQHLGQLRCPTLTSWP